MMIGYYIFLGNGDYHNPIKLDKNWTSEWSITEWKDFIDTLVEMDVNTLMIYLNGHRLPYKSKKYPFLVDHECRSVQDDFLKDLFEYIKEKKINLIGVLTTTGHAGGYSEYCNESKIVVSEFINNIEDTLISFPNHLRNGKLSKKEGTAQLGFGVLCHHNELAKSYAENIIIELIEFYGDYFDGIALHPPESVYPCYCILCCEKFFLQNKSDLNDSNSKESRKFFITSYLKYQEEYLFSLIRDKLKGIKLYSFTIPWFFESNMDDISKIISKDVVLIDWDYNLSKNRISDLPNRIKKYQKNGYEIVFMPTSGFSFNEKIFLKKQVELVHLQIQLAEENKVNGIIHFIGPKLNQHIFETSIKNKQCLFDTNKFDI